MPQLLPNLLCFISLQESKFDRYSAIEGEFAKSRFGLSVASLGDINRDGFEGMASNVFFFQSSAIE